MPVLALDTSADITVCLVADPVAAGPVGAGADSGPSAVLASRRVTEQRRHAELLAPMVAEVLAEAGVDRRALTAVVVGTGPAPFTGLRAGLVTARTLALALGIPVHGVCSLEAIAAPALRAAAAAGSPDAEVLVVTDARRREVYAARYRWDGHDLVAVLAPQVDHAEEVAARGAATGAVVVGPGASLHAEHLPPTPGHAGEVDPAELAAIAMRRVAAGGDLPTEPLYLRRPDVTPSAGRKRVTG